jgi:predicted nucleotidyltransferase
VRAHRWARSVYRAEPRTTRDVDIAISVDSDDAAEQVVLHLQSRGYVVGMLLEHEKTGRIATVRLMRESERSVYIDLLFASSGIEPEIVAAAEELAVLEDMTVRVATRAHLIAMKVLARDDRNRP